MLICLRGFHHHQLHFKQINQFKITFARALASAGYQWGWMLLTRVMHRYRIIAELSGTPTYSPPSPFSKRKGTFPSGLIAKNDAVRVPPFAIFTRDSSMPKSFILQELNLCVIHLRSYTQISKCTTYLQKIIVHLHGCDKWSTKSFAIRFFILVVLVATAVFKGMRASLKIYIRQP